MSQYFDKDFVKFLLGFIAIVLISLMLILGTRLYEAHATRTAGTITNSHVNP